MKLRGSQTDARPVGLPAEAFAGISVEFETDAGRLSCPEQRCVEAIASFRDAATQRAQAAAMKVLGAALAESHGKDRALLEGETRLECGLIASWNLNFSWTATNAVDQNLECRSCEIAAPVIAHILLNTPSAPWVVTCAALRALLRTNPIVGSCGRPPILVSPILDLFSRLEGYVLCDYKTLSRYRRFRQLVCDVYAVNALNSENETRDWVCNNLKRFAGASTAALGVVRAFLSSVEGNSQTCQNALSGWNDALECGLGAALKVLQDACRRSLDTALTSVVPPANAYGDGGSEVEFDLTDWQFVVLPKSILELNWPVLATRTLPRHCTVAAAVGIVTATVAGCDEYHRLNKAGEHSSQLMASENKTRDSSCPSTEFFSKADHLESLVEKCSVALEDRIIARSQQVPMFAQLALLRSIVENPRLDSVRMRLILGSQARKGGASDAVPGSISRGILERLCSMCTGNADLALRFLAMDSVVECLRFIHPGSLDASLRNRIIRLVEERCQEAYPGVPGQMRDAVDALVRLDDQGSKTLFWMEYLLRFLDAHYTKVGIYAPLSRLVELVGAAEILRRRPGLPSKLISVIASDANAAKPVSDWLEVFWRCFVRDTLTRDLPDRDERNPQCPTDVQDCISVSPLSSSKVARDITLSPFSKLVRPVLDGLLRDDISALRDRLITYVLPALFRSCEGSEAELVREFVESAESLKLTSDRMVRMYIAVISAARRNCARTFNLSDATLVEKLRIGVRSQDPDVRLTAFELVSVGNKGTEPISAHEFEFMFDVLPSCLFPGAPRYEVNRIQLSFGKFMDRIAGTRAAALSCNGWWAREKKLRFNGKRTELFESRRLNYLNAVSSFVSAVSARAVYSLAPGAAPDRRASMLQLLTAVLSAFGAEYVLNVLAQDCRLSETAILAPVFSCLGDTWEGPRQLAVALIGMLPSSISRMDASAGMTLLQSAIPHVLSPRVAEACPGSNVCRFVFKHCVVGLEDQYRRSKIQSDLVSYSGGVFPSFAQRMAGLHFDSSPIVHFYNSLLHHILERSTRCQSHFALMCSTGLFYGDICVLRGCIEDTKWSFLCANVGDGLKTVRLLARRILLALHKCVRLALRGLDIHGPAVEGISESASEIDNEASALLRPFSSVAVSDSTGTLRILTEDSIQKVITACHLSVKEACLTVGRLVGHLAAVRCAPSGGVSDGYELLDVDDVEGVGDIFDTVLSGVRHNGVIKGAADGYEEVCAQLLLSPNLDIRNRPQAWAENALRRAMAGEMYELRRSAGVPYFVLGAIRAEARASGRQGGVSSILCHIMEFLFSQLSEQGFSVSTGESASNLPLETPRDQPERTTGASDPNNGATVHCLNIMRLLFLDSTIARVMPRFVGRCVIISLSAFQSTSWLVRNSGFMLFSALVKRAVGTPQERKVSLNMSSFDASPNTSASMDGNRRMHSVTARQFFARYPELHKFLLDMLHKEISQERHAAKGESSNESALFPVLYLLSTFSASADEDAVNPVSVVHFELPVLTCLASRVECVRRVAAAACVPLLASPEAVPEVVREALATRLPQSGAELQSTAHFCQNKMHGELLRIGAILNGMRALLQPVTLSLLVSVLAEYLPVCKWIAADELLNPCSVTRSAMLRLMYRSLKLAKLAYDQSASGGIELTAASNMSDLLVILDLSEESSTCCLELKGRSMRGENCGIGVPAMLRTAAKLFVLVLRLRITLPSSSTSAKFLPAFTQLLRHPESEVREATLKSYGCILSLSAGHAEWRDTAANSIWGELVDRLQTEDCHPVLNRVILVLSQALELMFECRTSSGVGQTGMTAVWHRAVELGSRTDCVQLRETALVLLGHCVSTLNISSEKSDANATANDTKLSAKTKLTAHEGDGSIQVSAGDMNCWMGLLRIAYSDRQRPSTRAAALQSIEASKILQRDARDVAAARAEALIILIGLLQDDNEQVRRYALRLTQQLRVHREDGLVLDTLPALIAVHEAIPESDSLVLNYLEETLGMELKGDEDNYGFLHDIFDCETSHIAAPSVSKGMLDASVPKLLLNTSPSVTMAAEAHDYDFDFNEDGYVEDSKLFADDSDSLCVERDLMLQLAVWAIFCINTRTQKEFSPSLNAKKRALLGKAISQWTLDAVEILRGQAAEQMAVVSGSVPTWMVFAIKSGFERSKFSSSYFFAHQALARLAAACLLLPTEMTLVQCADRLSLIVADNHVRNGIHPSLVSSAEGIVRLLRTRSDVDALDSVLFLLPRLRYEPS